MGVRSNRALLKETARKLESPLEASRITEQPRRHDSSARCVHDPMTQGFWPGGVVGHVDGDKEVASEPGPFLVISRYTIWTHDNPLHTSCAPWPAGQLGAGRILHRCVCTYIAHGKQRRSPATRSWHLSCGNIFSIVVLWRSEPGLPLCSAYSSRNSSRCGPLLSLISPPRPRFCAADLPNPCWSTLRRGQPSTCY